MSVTVQDLRAWKAEGRRFAMLTAYDYPTAQIVDRAGVPVILVGDSVGDNMLGYDSTIPVTMEEMLHHCRAVSRGAENALLVGDMPFGSYEASTSDAIRNAGRFLKEAGMHAVKFEGPRFELAATFVSRGIPVMAHLGLTPQSEHLIGRRVQARTDEAAERLYEDALSMEKAGVFALVLEAIPSPLAERVTGSLQIPTIGIGAGPSCDGQVLVINDLRGLGDRKPAKFVKQYANVREVMSNAVRAYVEDVEAGRYPDDEHSYH